MKTLTKVEEIQETSKQNLEGFDLPKSMVNNVNELSVLVELDIAGECRLHQVIKTETI